MTGYISRLSFALLLLMPAMAQTTTDFNAVLTLNDADETPTQRLVRNFEGTGQVGTLGNALLLWNTFQALGDDYETTSGPVGGSLSIALNRLDQITISNSGIQNPDDETVVVTGKVNSGTGVFAGATSPNGATHLTLTRISDSPLRYNLSLTGAATVNGQQVDLAITDVTMHLVAVSPRVFDTQTGTAKVTPFGDATVTVRSRPDTNRWGDDVNFLEINLTLAFSPTDSLFGFLILDAPTDTLGPVTITGGTGRFLGAKGTATVLSSVETPDGEMDTLSGTVTEAGPSQPIITSVNTASGLNRITQNDWIEIKGINLTPPTTPAGGMFWSDAPEFAQGMMPTNVGGVSVTVDDDPAYVWWFCSVAAGCASDQINVLTSLNPFVGQVKVVVHNGTESSAPFMVYKDPVTPAFLIFDPIGHAVATHPDGSLVGPTDLYPGLSTPAAQNETISLWSAGFGPPATPLVEGSAFQSGVLPDPTGCYLDQTPVDVASALVSPGLYQFNVPIPGDTTSGEHIFFCTYQTTVSAAGVWIAVQ